MTNGSVATRVSVDLRLAVEDFLYAEAALLDNWQLRDWLDLLTDDVRYVVPTTDYPEGDPDEDLVFINDGIVQLQGRVTRLESRHAHREYPSSRTRRLIGNVRVTELRGPELDVEATFVIYRARGQGSGALFGHYRYTLVQQDDTFKIRYRRAMLDNESLSEHGAVSIIL